MTITTQRHTNMDDIKHYASRGILGIFASGGSVVVSLLPQIEAWLRVAGLLSGLLVTILSGVSIVRKWRREKEG